MQQRVLVRAARHRRSQSTARPTISQEGGIQHHGQKVSMNQWTPTAVGECFFTPHAAILRIQHTGRVHGMELVL